MAIVVRMPSVMAGATEASLQTWLVAPGDELVVGQPVAEIETEKAVVEYGAEDAGTVAALLVDPGEAIAVGSPILVLAEPGESADEARRAAAADAAGSPPADAAGSPPPTPSPVRPCWRMRRLRLPPTRRGPRRSRRNRHGPGPDVRRRPVRVAS